MSAEWVTAISTAAYTVGTLLLWRVTLRSLRVAHDLLRLNLLSQYYRSLEPAPNVGHGWETREVPDRINALRRKEAEVLKRAFPELSGLDPT